MPDYINKVVFGNQTLIDLTSDTLNSTSQLLYGVTAHDRSGATITGSCTYNADTSDANAAASELLSGKTAYVNGNKITGQMTNNGANNVTVTSKSGTTIPAGYYDGTGKAQIDSTSATALIATNIRQGVTILGVEGTMSGSENVKATTANVTPYTTAQTIVPADLGDYNSITQINVAAIAYNTTPNSYGLTATVGAVAPSS